MNRTVALGIQDFAKIRRANCFYVDKTHFIKEWWDSYDDVTLITRPRRFGKTLMLSTIDRFFSSRYENQAGFFEGLSIWNDADLRRLQGSLPVIFITFADVKETTYLDALKKLNNTFYRLYNSYYYLTESTKLNESDIKAFKADLNAFADRDHPDEGRIAGALQMLSEYLAKDSGREVIILMDEYDTPMQEAYVNGYWNEITGLFRSMFNASFKSNPYLGRALMTGITRVSRESMFSDLNNMKIVSVTTDKYTDSFGFTEQEVFDALDEYGYSDRSGVQHWYDGFTFGRMSSIYNPWSILNYLQEGEFRPYWSNTSSNSLASKLIREGNVSLKIEFEDLLQGKTILSKIDEQIVFDELGNNTSSVWSLLLASGYLKVVSLSGNNYKLALTNYEVRSMFERMVTDWFERNSDHYNDFCKALITADLKAMNRFMNNVALSTFSMFDSGKHPSLSEPERFYHGFVLGLMVDLKDRYIITSNRESGFGRYDVMLEPKDPAKDDGIILEFKVYDPDEEKTLQDTIASAHAQIAEKQYARSLIDHGVPADRIRSYGFAFEGKRVLIG